MSLGAVMQVVAAFMTVQAALIWFVDNFVRLAEWFTSVRRVDELVVALTDIDVGTNMSDEQSIQMLEGAGSEIKIDSEEYVILREDEILAVIEKTEKAAKK